jgi:hypothetical protein
MIVQQATTDQAQRRLGEGAGQNSRALATTKEQGRQFAGHASDAPSEWRPTVESALRAAVLAATAGVAIRAFLRMREK